MVSNTLALETMAPVSSMFLVLMIAVTSMAADWQAIFNDCGKIYEGMDSMIVGGHPAKEYAWPWQVAMLTNMYQKCGGSLINPMWVLTAAHCVNTSFLGKPEVFSFVVGTNNLLKGTNFTQVRHASRILVHPKFDFEDKYNFDNDIALFKMNGSFILPEDFRVNTICLPTGDMDDQFVVGQNATVTGWGTLKSGGPASPSSLYEAVVPIYNWTKCNQSLAGRGILFTDNMMCAGFEEGGVDSCQGDSGGPLVAYPSNSTDQYYQIGVVSWGHGCGNRSSPGVYTNVTRYEDWIRSSTQESCICEGTYPIYSNAQGAESIHEKDVTCACDETQKMSSSTIAAISVSVTLAIFIGISVALRKAWYKRYKKGSEQEPLRQDTVSYNKCGISTSGYHGYQVAE